MSQQQEMMTDRLVYVISSIQRERRSGMLTVKRGEGIALEEGTIVFANGQITEACVGRRRGAEARNWLSTWGSCRFMFVPTSPETGVQGFQSSLPAKGSSTNPPALGPPPHMANMRWSDPHTPMPSSLEGQEGSRVAGAWERTGKKGRTDTPDTPMPSSLEGQGGPRVAGAWTRTGKKERTDTPASAAAYPTKQLDAALRLIEQHGLSRIHRQLFYLVDGRRSIVELARLLGKSGSEIYKLLGDLERAHVIRIT